MLVDVMPSEYTLESSQSLQAIGRMLRDELDKAIVDTILGLEKTHKEKLQQESFDLTHKLKKYYKEKDQFKRVQAQRRLKVLIHQIKNHKKIFPEEYV